MRIDKNSGQSCVLVSGLHNPTSVRTPQGFGNHNGSNELFITEASGRILDVRLATK